MSDIKAVAEAVCVEVAKLQLGSDDVLVLRVSRTWSMEQVEYASKALQGALTACGIGNKFMTMSDECEFSVLTRAEIEAKIA